MSKFNTTKNPAICVLPWVHEYRNIAGKFAPCCMGETFKGNENIEQTREYMLKGLKPRVCNHCYETENKSGWSPRIQETNDWTSKFGDPDIQKPMLEFVDVRYDPTCNLKCKTCGPHDSTLWQKEKGIRIPVNISNQDYLDNIDKKQLKKVYLAGGEPTYIKGYLTFLQALHLVNPRCEVVINSNLKKLPDTWKQIIKKFDNLTVICSCDAIGTLATYMRYPLGWEEFCSNVKYVSENANLLQFNLVASNLTVHKLFETCSWMKQYSNHITLSILQSPKIFSECAVPYTERDVYLSSAKKLLKFPVSVYKASRFRNEVNLIIKKYAESKYDPGLHLHLADEIAEQDSHRTLKLQDVDGFLYGWINA